MTELNEKEITFLYFRFDHRQSAVRHKVFGTPPIFGIVFQTTSFSQKHGKDLSDAGLRVCSIVIRLYNRISGPINHVHRSLTPSQRRPGHPLQSTSAGTDTHT